LETQDNYSGCTPYVDYSPWGWNGIEGAKSSNCSSTTQQNRTYTCKKVNSFGVVETVDSSECETVDPSDLVQATGSDFSGCSFAWSPNDDTTGWSDWSSMCSANSTRSRTVKCIRSDGTAVPDASCSEPKPETSQTSAIYSACQNVLLNASFESAIGTRASDNIGWYVSASSAPNYPFSSDAHDGSRSLTIPASGTILSAGNNITVTGNYRYSFWCKRLAGNNSGAVRVSMKNSLMNNTDNLSGSQFTCGTEWTLIQWDRSYSVVGDVNLAIRNNASTGGIIVDDASLKQY
jgi:hypothetical protein